MSDTKTCVIKRTGRRATPYLVPLERGGCLRLNATGSHVAELSLADIAACRALPDTVVLPLAAKPVPAPAPVAPAKKARKAKPAKPTAKKDD